MDFTEYTDIAKPLRFEKEYLMQLVRLDMLYSEKGDWTIRIEYKNAYNPAQKRFLSSGVEAEVPLAEKVVYNFKTPVSIFGYTILKKGKPVLKAEFHPLLLGDGGDYEIDLSKMFGFLAPEDRLQNVVVIAQLLKLIPKDSGQRKITDNWEPAW